jgi:hypothetical protein
VVYKLLTPIDQSELVFLITSDLDTVNPDIKLYIRGKFTKPDGSDLDTSDHTAGVNNFLHSLFCHCTISLNGVNITQSGEHYNYRAYLETLLTYGVDVSLSHLTNSYWYKDVGDMLPCDPTQPDSRNTGFIDRWIRQKQYKEIEMYGRILSDICNVPKFLLPNIRLQVKFTKAKPIFYLMNTTADSKTIFKFLDAKLIVRRVRPNPRFLLAHEETLKLSLARYNLTRVKMKTFTFSSGPQSLSIDQAIMVRVPKRLLFAMIDNRDFLRTMIPIPIIFNISDFVR